MICRDCSQQLSHPDLQMPRIKKDETHVKAFMELMEKSWVDPLSPGQAELIGLSTGVVVAPDVAVTFSRLTALERKHTTTSRKIAWGTNH